ncbi:MAG: SAM-dependent methyltransferase [Streptosporangiaceae bacterium]
MADHDWMTVDPDSDPPQRIDATVAHQARIYDYLLGGKDNFEVDREAAARSLEVFPGFRAWARNNRAFLSRAVRYVMAEGGIRQFLDIGTGLPTADNTHNVAQRIDPSARICYVDNDPAVLAHARALLTSDPAGATDYVHADLRTVDRILDAAAHTLDFGQPVAVMLLAILHAIKDEDAPWAMAGRIMAAVPPGSFLVISHPANDLQSTAFDVTELTKRLNERMGAVTMHARGHDAVARFFTGLELVPPGIVPTPEWRPDPEQDLPEDNTNSSYAAVARKPAPA